MKEKRDWDQVFKDWESSGKTIKDYCKGNHISVAAFYKNKRVFNVVNIKFTKNVEIRFTNFADVSLIIQRI